MEIERKIRARIESILVNDARNHEELKALVADSGPLEEDVFSEERNLYQRIINSYRSAVGEVNGLLEESVSFLSGFYKIVESIRDKKDFQEICSQIVDCVLQDLGAEYCSIVFRNGNCGIEPICLEGIREERKFITVQERPCLLGGAEFERTITRLMSETTECLNIGDVYRDPDFNSIDFPSVVRALACLPIVAGDSVAGTMILGHSMPHFFNDNLVRVLKILSGNLSHLLLLTGGISMDAARCPKADPERKPEAVYSVILLRFERPGSTGRGNPDIQTVRDLHHWIAGFLNEKELLLHYHDRELLALLPGTPAEALPARVRELEAVFLKWKETRPEHLQSIRMDVGFTTCDEEQDLTRTLRTASLMMEGDQVS